MVVVVEEGVVVLQSLRLRPVLVLVLEAYTLVLMVEVVGEEVVEGEVHLIEKVVQEALILEVVLALLFVVLFLALLGEV